MRNLGQLVLQRLRSFTAFHALNTVLNLCYTFLQLIVITRVVDPPRYAEIVLLLSMGFYFQPFDQAIGRANYIRLNEQSAAAVPAGQMHEVSLLELVHTVLMLAICFAFPLIRQIHNPELYLQDSLLLVSVLLMNSWAFSLQPTAWAVGLELLFSVLTLIRRFFHLIALVVLWSTGSMLLFCVAVGTTSFVFHILARVSISRRSRLLPLVPDIRSLSMSRIVHHIRQVANSFLSSLSELMVVNSLYIFIAWFYGAGSLMVIFDSIMKVARLSMTAARVFVETRLPRIMRLLADNQTRAAERFMRLASLICLLGALFVAGAVLIKGEVLFSLLLGPNNLVRPETFPVAACIILAATSYQPMITFLSYGNFQSTIKSFSVICSIGFVVLGGLILMGGGNTHYTLWLYVAYCSGCVLTGAALLHFQLAARHAALAGDFGKDASLKPVNNA